MGREMQVLIWLVVMAMNLVDSTLLGANALDIDFAFQLQYDVDDIAIIREAPMAAEKIYPLNQIHRQDHELSRT